MTALQLIDIHKRYPSAGGTLTVLSGVSLTVRPGEFVGLIGPSGSGKSTLFNLVAGLERPDSGRILLGGAERGGPPGHVAYMPQRDALLPWRSVLENAVIPALVRRDDVASARCQAEALLEAFGDSLPGALSGGMRQRAALLRTVLWPSPVMLLDEPFGALDALTRAQLQAWLLGLWGRLDRTILLVTHDIDEALLLSDRVYVLSPRPGRITLELPLELPRPRDHAVTSSPAFLRYRATLHRQLVGGQA